MAKKYNRQETGAWIFQANPKYYDILNAVREQEVLTWGVQKAQVGKIQPGHRAYIWMCGKGAGIVATGVVETIKATQSTWRDQYTKDDRAVKQSTLCEIRLDSVMLDKPLERTVLLENKRTRDIAILHQPQGTNFPVKAVEAEAVEELLAHASFIDVPPVPAAVLAQYASGRPGKTPKMANDPYNESDFLQDVFLSGDELARLLKLVRRRRNLVLEGPPGVGKSYVARRLAWLLLGEKDEARLREVQFHQSYSYDDFVQGWRPKGAGFELEPGVAFTFCTDAKHDPAKRPHVLLLDEINRGNLSNIFGELLSLIEPTQRGQTVCLRSGEALQVPENLYIIGTMNTADRSIADFTYAHRRRFAFYPLAPAFERPGFAAHLQAQGVPQQLVQAITSRLPVLNRHIVDDNLGEGYCVGHSFFCGYDGDEDWYRDVIEYEIRPLLREYYPGDPDRQDELAALLLEDEDAR